MVQRQWMNHFFADLGKFFLFMCRWYHTWGRCWEESWMAVETFFSRNFWICWLPILSLHGYVIHYIGHYLCIIVLEPCQWRPFYFEGKILNDQSHSPLYLIFQVRICCSSLSHFCTWRIPCSKEWEHPDCRGLQLMVLSYFIPLIYNNDLYFLMVNNIPVVSWSSVFWYFTIFCINGLYYLPISSLDV